MRGLDLSLLDAATPFGGPYWPVFVSPPPREPHPTIETELDRVAADPPGQVVTEITQRYGDGLPAGARPFVEDPAGALGALVGQMRALWDAVLAPRWATISALLEAELTARARSLVAVGRGRPSRTCIRRCAGKRTGSPSAPAVRTGRRRPRRPWPAPHPVGVHLAAGLATDRPALGPGPGLPTARNRRPLGAGRRARRGPGVADRPASGPDPAGARTAGRHPRPRGPDGASAPAESATT